MCFSGVHPTLTSTRLWCRRSETRTSRSGGLRSCRCCSETGTSARLLSRRLFFLQSSFQSPPAKATSKAPLPMRSALRAVASIPARALSADATRTARFSSPSRRRLSSSSSSDACDLGRTNKGKHTRFSFGRPFPLHFFFRHFLNPKSPKTLNRHPIFFFWRVKKEEVSLSLSRVRATTHTKRDDRFHPRALVVAGLFLSSPPSFDRGFCFFSDGNAPPRKE